jgi:hypothetical protein
MGTKMHVVVICLCLLLAAAIGWSTPGGDSPAAKTEELPLVALWATAESAGYYRGMTSDVQGNVYAVGNGYVTDESGQPRPACVVAKYGPDGELLWARQAILDQAVSQFETVAVDRRGNIYAAGSMAGGGVDFGNGVRLEKPSPPPQEYESTGRMLMVKYDPMGRAQWVQTGPVREFTQITSMAVDAAGNAYAVGVLSSGEFDPYDRIGFSNEAPEFKLIPESQESGGYILAKFSPQGKALWAAVPGGGAYVRFESVVVDGTGNVYVAGQIGGEGTAAFGAGVLLSAGTGSGRPVLVKYSPSGAAQWARAAVSAGAECDLQHLAIDSGGNLYATGTLDGAESCDFGNGVVITGSSPMNPFLVRYSPTGQVQWARTILGGSCMWYSRTVAVEGASVYLALEVMRGDSSEYHDFGNGIGLKGGEVIVRYDPSGVPLWAAKPPGGLEVSDTLVTDEAGYVYLRGSADSQKTTDFGNGVVLDKAESYIAKYRNPAFAAATCLNSRVRVRSAGNLQADTRGYLEKGDRVEVLEKSAEKMKIGEMTDYWYRVRRLSDGLTGWSFGPYLEVEQ